MSFLSQFLDQIQGQTVLVRCNFDVPLENGQVGDTTRIENAVSTIKALRQNQNKLILLAHAGRPEGTYKEEDSLKPVAALLSSLIGEEIHLSDYHADINQTEVADQPVVMLENLRFWSEEEGNDEWFARYLAGLGDTYVNESFAASHREHASIVGVPKFIPGYLGLGFETELKALGQVLENPKKPLVIIIGGAKLETKAPLIEAFPEADKILVGGLIAKHLKGKPDLPANVVLADLVESGKDITEASAREFAETIMAAGTVVWNGTMGVFEEAEFQAGTRIVATAVNQTPAYTLIGGGDTEAALTDLDAEGGIDYIATGGGAMLTYLSTKELAGVTAITTNQNE